MTGNNQNPVKLNHSALNVQTYYEGTRRVVHRFRLGRFFGTMDEGVEAFRAEFVNPMMEEELALSGIQKFVASMQPHPGGTGYDKENNRHYLAPEVGVNYVHRTPYWPNIAQARFGPYHTILGQRISTFDFAPMVAHVMRNTNLQNDEFAMGRDPRLDLVEFAKELTEQ